MSPLTNWVFFFLGANLFSPLFVQGDPDEYQMNNNWDDDVCYHDSNTFHLTCTPAKNFNLECPDVMQPRTWVYTFYLELYHSMGDACGDCGLGKTSDCYNPECVQANGVQKGILTVNRQLPGPLIEVCEGDTIIVDVKNGMTGLQETIHWHGFIQKGTPWMDGVPMVTQCPIPYPSTFRYTFEAEEAGTYWYHSHAGMHKVDGINGPLIVRKPKRYEVNRYTYDEDLSEHVIFLNDWLNYDSSMYVPGLNFPFGAPLPDSILINGRGKGVTTLGAQTVTPVSVFTVQANKRYRFRIINGGSLICPIMITIQNHSMLIISTDKDPVFPQPIDAIVLYTGERYDCVVETNQTAGSYWIVAKAVGVCTGVLNPAIQVAKLQYDSNTRNFTAEPRYNDTLKGMVLNLPSTPNCRNNTSAMCVDELSCNGNPELINRLDAPVDITHYINMGFVDFDAKTFFKLGTYNTFRSLPGFGISAGHMNNNSMVFPASPLLTQHVMPDRLCTDQVRPADCPGNTFCECTHIISLPCNKVVELVLIDPMTVPEAPPLLDHPMHLHGYAFAVMGSGTFTEPGITNEKVKQMDQAGKLRRVNHIPPLKDTVSVPQYGYTIIRFYTDNPGFWFFHCHFQFHMVVGMEMVFEVKECPDTRFPLQKPPCFPTCGNYEPEYSCCTETGPDYYT